jgi:hypothetical protein
MPYVRVKITFSCNEEDLDEEKDIVENINDIYQVLFECQIEGTENYFSVGPGRSAAKLIADLSEAMNERQLNRTDEFKFVCRNMDDSDISLEIKYEYQTEILSFISSTCKEGGNFGSTTKVHRRYIVNELNRKLGLHPVEL